MVTVNITTNITWLTQGITISMILTLQITDRSLLLGRGRLKVLKKERYFVSEIFTVIFDMERVLLQPANSLLQPAKKVRI